MLNLFGKKPPILTVRLNVLEEPEGKRVDRQALADALLKTWQHFFGSLPQCFDIYGPYGIAKGQSIGIRAFENKLEKKGHEAYSGYSAFDDGIRGFHVSFFTTPPYNAQFVEIVLWFRNLETPVDTIDMVRKIATAVPIDYGYTSELPGNFEPIVESPVKHGIFGGRNIEVGRNSLRRWHGAVQSISAGRIRDVYPINFLNTEQFHSLRRIVDVKTEMIGDTLHVLKVESASQRDTMKRDCAQAGTLFE